MKKDDPQELLTAFANRLRTEDELRQGKAIVLHGESILTAIADAADPPPESKQEFPPGTLVKTSMGYPLIITQTGGVYLSGLQPFGWSE